MGYLVAARLPPTYESEARLLVGPVSGDQDLLQAAGQQARATPPSPLRPSSSGPPRELGMSSGSLRSKLEDVTASEVTRLLSIRVRDGDSTRAALIANAVADELVAYSREEGALAPPAGELRIVERNRHQRRDRSVGATDRPAGRRRRPSRRVRSRRGRGRSLDRSPERAGTGRARSSGRSRLDQRNAAPVQEPTVRGRGRSRLQAAVAYRLLARRSSSRTATEGRRASSSSTPTVAAREAGSPSTSPAPWLRAAGESP